MSIEGLTDAQIAGNRWSNIINAPTAGALSNAGGGSPESPLQFVDLVRIDLPIKFSQTWRIELAQLVLASSGGLPTDLTVAPVSTQASMRLRWGTGAGVKQEAIIDYPASGGGFYVSGCYVELGIRDPEGQGVFPGALPGRYAAHITPASPVDRYNSSPTRTLQFGTLGPAAFTASQYIPEKAIGAYVMSNELSISQQFNFIFQRSGQTVSVVTSTQSAFRNTADLPHNIPIPAQANTFTIQNTGLGNMGNTSVRFVLDIG